MFIVFLFQINILCIFSITPIGIVLKHFGSKFCISGWLVLLVDSIAWWYSEVCRNGLVHLCCELAPKNGGTCSVGGYQLNINMCTIITLPWNNNINASNSLISLTPDPVETLSWSPEAVWLYGNFVALLPFSLNFFQASLNSHYKA